MFLTIVRKELLANILTFKFLTGFALCIVLIVSSAYLLTQNYEERLRDYNDAVRKHRSELRTAVVYFVDIRMKFGYNFNVDFYSRKVLSSVFG